MVTVEQRLFANYKQFKKELDLGLFKEDIIKLIRNYLIFFEQGLSNIKNKNYEMAYIAFCCVIEGLAAKKYFNLKYISFENWLSSNKTRVILPKNVDTSEYLSSIKHNLEEYYKLFGARRNFVKTILEKYKETKTAPSFLIQYETIKIKKGLKMSQWRSKPFDSEDQIFNELSKELKEIYDAYRSPIVHLSKPLNFVVKIRSKIGGLSMPESISPQSFGLMVLDVLKYNLSKKPFIKTK